MLTTRQFLASFIKLRNLSSREFAAINAACHSVTTNLGDHCGLVPASELLELAHLQSSLDDWPQCLLGIQPMLASVITILLNVHPTSQPCVKMN